RTVRGTAAAHDYRRPPRAVERSGVGPSAAGAAPAGGALFLIDRLRRPAAGRTDEDVVRLHPVEHPGLREIVLLPGFDDGGGAQRLSICNRGGAKRREVLRSPFVHETFVERPAVAARKLSASVGELRQ